MPVIMEEVTVTERDVIESARMDTIKRVDRFIKTANEKEARQIRSWSEHRLLALGVIQPVPKIRKRDRFLSRLAVESVPILLTLLVVIPVVAFGMFALLRGTYLVVYTSNCPTTCSQEALIIWSLVSGLAFLIIILAYYSVRQLMLRARK